MVVSFVGVQQIFTSYSIYTLKRLQVAAISLRPKIKTSVMKRRCRQ